MLTKASSSSTNPRTAHRDGGALQPRKPQAGDKAAPKARRRPVFTLTLEQVLQRCRKLGHCLWVAGQVLALRALMEARNWTILELAERSGVPRSHLSEILVLKTTASTRVQHILAETFGFELFEFHLLTFFSLRAEVSGERH